MATGRPRTNWKRVSNCPGGIGTSPKNKYNFSTYLKRVGDFVETHPMPRDEMLKVFYAAHIWAYRKHCRIRTEVLFFPEGRSLHIEVISNTRKERK